MIITLHSLWHFFVYLGTVFAGFQQHDTLQERLRTHKLSQKTSVFSLNYHKFSIKSYVLDVY